MLLTHNNVQVTHKVLATPDVIREISSIASPLAAQVVKLLQFFSETYKQVFRFTHPPVHDPVAVAYVIAPHIFKGERMRVDVEMASALCAGQTVCDTWHMSGQRENVWVALEVDAEEVWRLIVQAVGDCSRRCVGGCN
jgi:inosine-uridine nucleoside N-ribohydrolase